MSSHTEKRARLGPSQNPSAALRWDRAAARGAAAAAAKAAARGDARRAGLLKAGWGDEEAGAGPLNPHYDPDLYQSYSLSTRR